MANLFKTEAQKQGKNDEIAEKGMCCEHSFAIDYHGNKVACSNLSSVIFFVVNSNHESLL